MKVLFLRHNRFATPNGSTRRAESAEYLRLRGGREKGRPRVRKQTYLSDRKFMTLSLDADARTASSLEQKSRLSVKFLTGEVMSV